MRPLLRLPLLLLLLVVASASGSWLVAASAGASVSQTAPTPPTPPVSPAAPPTTVAPSDGRVSFDVDLGTVGGDGSTDGKPSKSIVILLGLTVLAIAPSLVILMTSFTRMVVVLGLARNAIGLQTVPPNQVLTGLAVFLSLFVMAPTIKQINDEAWQPYQRGEITQSVALKKAETPIKTWMLKNTRREELDLMLGLSKSVKPEKPEDTSMTALIPAFVLSELKSAFIIGVMILLPFLVIDLVVSSGLMSLGMMMLPPVFVSLPFKLLLFVMVDGWSMIAHALVANYH